MSHRGFVLLFLACAVLCFVSDTRSASRNSHLSPTSVPRSTSGFAAPSTEYPNTTEGLQSLMLDMLSATKRGEREKVDALMKQTEFTDYAQYFASTYSPDAPAAGDWAITYQRWLGDNENQLR